MEPDPAGPGRSAVALFVTGQSEAFTPTLYSQEVQLENPTDLPASLPGVNDPWRFIEGSGFHAHFQRGTVFNSAGESVFGAKFGQWSGVFTDNVQNEQAGMFFADAENAEDPQPEDEAAESTEDESGNDEEADEEDEADSDDES